MHCQALTSILSTWTLFRMKPRPHSLCVPYAALFPLLVALAAASPTEPDPIGQSPQIQDGIQVRAPTTCPVLQDGATSTTFPWTHVPTCLPLILPVSEHGGRHNTYCVYTNAAFNDGRGISIVTSPESAAELASEVWETGLGRGRAEEGQWEAREMEEKGVGLIAKRPVDSGETVILESPVVVVGREVLGSVSHSRRRVLLEKAVEQLPEPTRDMVMALSRRGGESEIEDIVNVNAVGAKVWDGMSHLIMVPEAAVCLPFLLLSPQKHIHQIICRALTVLNIANQPRLPPKRLLPFL